jgi:hypothetical protein
MTVDANREVTHFAAPVYPPFFAKKQHRQCTYNVTLRRVRVTTVVCTFVVTPCRLVYRYQNFKLTCCSPIQAWPTLKMQPTGLTKTSIPAHRSIWHYTAAVCSHQCRCAYLRSRGINSKCCGTGRQNMVRHLVDVPKGTLRNCHTIPRVGNQFAEMFVEKSFWRAVLYVLLQLKMEGAFTTTSSVLTYILVLLMW